MYLQEEEPSRPQGGDSSDDEDDGEKNNKYDKAGKLRKMKHEQQVSETWKKYIYIDIMNNINFKWHHW